VQDIQVWRELLIGASDEPEEAYMRTLIDLVLRGNNLAGKVCRRRLRVVSATGLTAHFLP
jgi:hypothetical protein